MRSDADEAGGIEGLAVEACRAREPAFAVAVRIVFAGEGFEEGDAPAQFVETGKTALKFALVTPRIVLLAAVLGLALGAVAGGLAAWRVVRVAPQKLGER